MGKPSIRPPPAYQEYAADLLAKENFILMSALERGVLFSVRLRCWIDQSVPSQTANLARLIGLDVKEVEEGMTPRVKSFLALDTETTQRWVSPDLERYRASLLERKAKQVQGASRGGKKSAAQRSGKPQANLEGCLPPPEMNGTELNRTELKPTEASRDEVRENLDIQSWIDDYDSAEYFGR